MVLTRWWTSAEWFRYEALYGDRPGTRHDLLTAATWNTRVVNLGHPVPVLWRGLRSSYRPLINRLGRTYPLPGPDQHLAAYRRVVQGGDGLDAAAEVMPSLRRLHAIEAGRQTRPDATWDVQADWVRTGHGLVAYAVDIQSSPLVGEAWFVPVVGFAYFVIDGAWAYYFSGVSAVRDLSAGLIWWAMLALKARGVRVLELGWQGEAKDDKGKNIEFFKRGLGGFDVPLGGAERWSLDA